MKGNKRHHSRSQLKCFTKGEKTLNVHGCRKKALRAAMVAEDMDNPVLFTAESTNNVVLVMKTEEKSNLPWLVFVLRAYQNLNLRQTQGTGFSSGLSSVDDLTTMEVL